MLPLGRHLLHTAGPNPLRLTVLPGSAGLVFLATGRPGLALHCTQALPGDGLARWRGLAWQQASAPQVFGAAFSQALLPAALQTALAAADGGPLLLLVDASLADLPWELACIGGQLLDDRFLTSRLVLVADALGQPPPLAGLAPDAALDTAQDEPSVTAGLHLALDDDAAAAAGRAGQLALHLPLQAQAARQLLHQALADGASPARAAQAMRQAARSLGTPGGDAWLHGEAVLHRLGVAANAATNAAANATTSMAAGAAAAASLAAPGLAPSTAPLPAPDDDVRQVSILSVDLVGSTRLMHELGDEEYSERLTLYHQKVAQVARAHAGLADDPQGDDGFMCYFGHPVASEDAAAMAVRAGLTLAAAMDDAGPAAAHRRVHRAGGHPQRPAGGRGGAPRRAPAAGRAGRCGVRGGRHPPHCR